MTGQEFLKFHSDTLDMMKKVCAAKNNDYAGGKGGDDAFANFRLVSVFGAASSEQGFFTRMTDKMSRISTFIQKGALLVKDETVIDTLIDLANYCILFAGFLESERMKKKSETYDESMSRAYKDSLKGSGSLPNHSGGSAGGSEPFQDQPKKRRDVNEIY